MKAKITTEQPSPALAAELAPFLSSVLKSPRFDDADFLTAMYCDAPTVPMLTQARLGAGDEAGDRSGGGGRVVAHQAFLWIPMRTSAGTTLPATLSVNSAAAPEVRGTGAYAELSISMMVTAFDAGTLAYFGVTNEGSMKTTTRLGGKVVTQLPVRLLATTARPERSVTHHPVDAALLDGDLPEVIAAEVDRASTFGVRYGWNAELLRWRLGFPGSSLVLTEHPDFFLVSAVRKVGPAPAVVLLKVWARHAAAEPQRLPVSIVAALAQHHRTPAVVHVGRNRDVSLVGVPVPRRLRPAPLYLTYYANPAVVATQEIDFDTFEFLEFDAL